MIGLSIRTMAARAGGIAPGLQTLLLALVVLSVSAACRSHEPALEDLKSLDAFKARFNADEGKPRLVLLLSPT
jgi:hypothetical protein